MSSMLQAILDDPSPGPSVEKEAAFHPAARLGDTGGITGGGAFFPNGLNGNVK